MWILFALVALSVSRDVLQQDFRKQGIIGDAASFVLQAESLGYSGHDLAYDGDDLEYFRSFGWSPEPYGLYFQRNDDGWAPAKPYGYSAVLAPAFRLFGPRRGLALANLGLMAVIGAAGVAMLRTRLRGPVIPIVVGAFLFGSYLRFYAYHPWTELFLAALVATFFLCALKADRDGHVLWRAAALCVGAYLISEKAPMITLVGPVGLYLLIRAGSWRRGALMAAAAAITFVVAITPYVATSDGASWTPYGGERYYAAGGVPFGDSDGTYSRVDSDETFSLTYVRENALGNLDDSVVSAGYYFVGRHSGMLPFMPVALFAIVASIASWRRGDTLARCTLIGLGAYVVFYLVLFPLNFSGGGQTLGNRYFLQVSPVVLALLAMFPIKARTLAIGAAASWVAALVFLAPHFDQPFDALRRLEITSRAQRVLPFEGNQDGEAYFRCGRGVCPDDE
ncbi:MAG TPA: hypothetical protein VK507_04500 [Iamia sp.]|nr:hypothetical protein [Iamia sp.]